MKKAKIDRISMLPDPILHLILSRLHSTMQVCRMSVLSTRWKYLWTSIPSLDIDHRNPHYWFQRDELKDFVYWVLLKRTVDLDSFTLDCREYDYDMPILWRWIHIVVMRKVKKIDLKLSLRNWYEAVFVLPPCLVDCGSLEMFTLNLSLGSLSLKSFTGSKTIKVLRLDSVKLFDPHLVPSFLVNCPLLEELSLINCITENTLLERLTVVCPKLVYFKYGGHIANHFSFDAKSLKKAVIELKDMKLNEERDANFGVTICELFVQVSHVEYLSINRFFHQSKECECCNLPEEGFPESLPNLKKLELKLDCDLMVVLLRILKCSFNLESLHLIIPKDISSSEVERFFKELEEVETRRTLTCHLKRVEFSDFIGGKEKTLAIARFLLKHGNALEEMVFTRSKRDAYGKQLMEAIYKVSNFDKASSSVNMITLDV